MARLRIPIRIVGASAESSESHRVRWETGWPALQNKLATTAADLAAARVLRTQSFRPTGIFAGPEITSDDLDTASNSRVFVLYEERQPVGTVRVMTGDAKHGRATFFSRYFSAEIAATTGSYVEVTHFAIARPRGSRDPRHVLALLQNVTSEADRNQAGFVLAALDPNHQSFYAALGFRQLSEACLLTGWPYSVSLSILDWVQERDRLRDSYTFRRCFSTRNHVQSS